MEKICEKHNEIKVLWAKKYKCKSCNREYQSKWFADNKIIQSQRVKGNNVRYKERNARYVYNYLSTHPCLICNESDPVVLQFDHRDPSLKTNAISYLISGCARIDSIKEEIDKCDVLCANCHTKRTAKQFGWRKLAYNDE